MDEETWHRVCIELDQLPLSYIRKLAWRLSVIKQIETTPLPY